jgi:hypothetical protein
MKVFAAFLLLVCTAMAFGQSGANANAAVNRKQVEQQVSSATCTRCGIVRTPTPVQAAEQVVATARAKVKQDTEQLVRDQARVDAVLKDKTTPPAVRLRLRAHLEQVMLEPQRAPLTLAQANAAAAEQEYQKAQAVELAR